MECTARAAGSARAAGVCLRLLSVPVPLLQSFHKRSSDTGERTVGDEGTGRTG